MPGRRPRGVNSLVSTSKALHGYYLLTNDPFEAGNSRDDAATRASRPGRPQSAREPDELRLQAEERRQRNREHFAPARGEHLTDGLHTRPYVDVRELTYNRRRAHPAWSWSPWPQQAN
jgi:hypothetical protein